MKGFLVSPDMISWAFLNKRTSHLSFLYKIKKLDYRRNTNQSGNIPEGVVKEYLNLNARQYHDYVKTNPFVVISNGVVQPISVQKFLTSNKIIVKHPLVSIDIKDFDILDTKAGLFNVFCGSHKNPISRAYIGEELGLCKQTQINYEKDSHLWKNFSFAVTSDPNAHAEGAVKENLGNGQFLVQIPNSYEGKCKRTKPSNLAKRICAIGRKSKVALGKPEHKVVLKEATKGRYFRDSIKPADGEVVLDLIPSDIKFERPVKVRRKGAHNVVSVRESMYDKLLLQKIRKDNSIGKFVKSPDALFKQPKVNHKRVRVHAHTHIYREI